MIISGGQLVLADATPMGFRSLYYSSTGVSLSQLFASYGAIYKQQHAVYTLVRKRALATKRLPFKVYERDDTGRAEVRSNGYAVLLRQPNPRMSGGFLWEWTSSTYDVYGEAIWLKVRGRDRRPAELWPVHPANIAVEVAGEEQAQRFSVPLNSLLYVYYAGLALASDPQYVIPEADVVHFKSYNPQSTVRGLSPIEPLRMTLLNEDAARRATASFWENGARPGYTLEHPGELSSGAQARLKAQWDAVAGGADKTGSTVVLEEGMTAKQLTLSAEEAQYIETRKLNMTEACMAYDVPPPVVHILDRATFSNITEQMRSMYRDTMAPHLGGFEDTLDHQLRPEFGDDDLYGEFLMDEVLRGDFEQRVTAYQAGINSGWLMPAEVRRMENLPPVEGADRLFVNATLIPIDEASQRTSPNEPAKTPPPTPAEIAAATSPQDAAATRSLMGRLGRLKTLDGINEASLVDGMNGMAATVLAELRAARDGGETVGQFRARVHDALGVRTKSMGAGMNPQMKTLTLTVKAAGDTADPLGGFEAILSTDTVDREGEKVTVGAFNPLPDSIPIHYGHDWTSGGLPVGKGVPFYDGNVLKVKGTFAPTDRGQEVRALVTGGFVTSMSAGFLTEKRKGNSILKGDLLEGSFTTTPVNTTALVLNSKAISSDGVPSIDIKAGARNSKGDQSKIQDAHDLMAQLGASCSAVKSLKAIVGSVEALQCRVSDALEDAYGGEYGYWGYLRGVVPNDAGDGGTVIFQSSRLGGDFDSATYQQDFTDDGSVVTLTGTAVEVDIEEHVVPDADADREPVMLSVKPKAVATSDAAPVAASDAAPADEDDELERQRQRVRAWQYPAA